MSAPRPQRSLLESSDSLALSASTIMHSTDAAERQRASEQLRRDYEDIYRPMPPGMTSRAEQLAHTQARVTALNDAAKKIAAAEVASGARPSSRRYTFTVVDEDGEQQSQTTHSVDGESFTTVGRMLDSHVLLPQNDRTLSRTNAMLMLTDTQLLVVDVGSLAGVRTVKRAPGGAIYQHSLPRDRNVLRFELGESFTLGMGEFGAQLRVEPVAVSKRARSQAGEPVHVEEENENEPLLPPPGGADLLLSSSEESVCKRMRNACVQSRS